MIPRYVPSRRVLRIAAWVAFWPVAFTAVHGSLLATCFIVATFVPIVVPKRAAAIFGGFAVGSAIALVERTLVPSWAATGIGMVAVLAYEWLMRHTHERDRDPLDASARVVAPVALAIALCGVFTAHGAQAAHLHATFPRIAQLLAGIATALSIVAIVARRSIARAAARAYGGHDGLLTVRSIDDDVDLVRLSDVPACEAAIVEGTSTKAGPYRAGEGRPIARVPIAKEAFDRRQRTFLVEALVVTALCVGSTVLVAPSFSRVAHHVDLASSPTTLPPLPGECTTFRPKLRFVALAPLRVLDIEDIAARYRAAGIADVVVERPLEAHELWIDRARGQIAGEDIARAASKKYDAHRNELVVVVTDRDMFLREVDWRFAFATRERGVAVVSIARMDPHFPLFAPASWEPAPSDCPAPVRARAFRMITRQVLLSLCTAETVDDPRSIRRRSVMGLSDLDAIDEATY